MKERYVLGFAFDLQQTHVLLCHKNRPTWQAGKLNGIGGKIEPGEGPYTAMVREFAEETGIHAPMWTYIGSRSRAVGKCSDGYEMFIYAVTLDRDVMLSAQDHETDEPIDYHLLDLNAIKLTGVDGLAWIVDAALDALNSKFEFEIRDTPL